ncbi:hypothetical protein KGQ20_06770 [Catenulispora sp. NF23]|uniref:hypothetical protein n=1 Tax=Catenulispora pinistramenti TaxID=2705254 RepID=UPI001BA7D091|nr:hypothetical protein [Catenulispora pinistramenti]MBS2532471.1 hypothetical protein [Catenulispora pinistramenti]
MNDEEFDGSAVRELFAPAVADRGLTSAPTDAIVAAGRRRIVGRRAAVAGGALAIVAAVPLAATAIAAGPDKAGSTTNAASNTGTTKAPGLLAPPDAKTLTKGVGVGDSGAPSSPAKSDTGGDPAGLPTKPTVVATGSIEGHTWTVTFETIPGNNALTAGDKCLGLVLTVDGHTSSINPSMGPYCLPVKYEGPSGLMWAIQYTLKYYYPSGAGTLQMGMVPANVAKVVAHVDGLAPVSAATIPAPGLNDEAFYFLPIPKDDQGFRVSFDEYDTQGVKIGSFNNWTPAPGQPPNPTNTK